MIAGQDSLEIERPMLPPKSTMRYRYTGMAYRCAEDFDSWPHSRRCLCALRLAQFLSSLVPLIAVAQVHADVLYDSTGMSEDDSWDHTLANYISGESFFGQVQDVQNTDDFEITASYNITRLTSDFWVIGGNLPGDGVLIEFFEDIDGTPSNTPFAQEFVQTYEAILLDIDNFPTYRIAVDLADSGVTLSGGTWWVAITPVDESPEGDRFNQLGSTLGLFGDNAHARDGGVAHGNGYPGPHGVDEWTLPPLIGNIPDLDLAMKIEGTRLGDFNDDGIVGVVDLLFLLGEWGRCPPKGDCPADIVSDGAVGVSDLLMLLGQWG